MKAGILVGGLGTRISLLPSRLPAADGHIAGQTKAGRILGDGNDGAACLWDVFRSKMIVSPLEGR
jgi:hypothetical protein